MHSQYSKIKKNMGKDNYLSEEFVFDEQVFLLKAGIDVVEKKLSLLKNNLGLMKVGSEKDNSSNEVLEFKCDSLEYFCQLSKFLIERIEEIEYSKKTDLRFYFPNIRALIDIYSKLLYLNSKDESTCQRIVACQNLRILKVLDDKKRFYSFLKKYETIFQNCDYNISSFEKFPKPDKNKKNLIDNFCFPGVKKMISSAHFKNINLSLGEDKLKLTIKEMHSFCCEYAHGNSILKNVFGKEHFWIIISLRSLLELTMVLFEGFDFEVSGWRREVENKNKNFITIYGK